jgi:hypothetical protein
VPPGTVAKKPPLTPRQQRLREQRQLATTRPWLAELPIDSPSKWRAAAEGWLDPADPMPLPPDEKPPLTPRQQRLRERRELATTRPWLADVPVDSPAKWRAAADEWLDPNEPPPAAP